MAKPKQPAGKAWSGWALYQWGTPWGVHRTKREAVAAAVESSGEPWKKCRTYFSVRRARVTPQTGEKP